MYHLRAGFTLLEVLIVITIIGILATVILASTGQARDQARAVAAQRNLEQIELALITFMLKEQLSEWPTHPGGMAYQDNEIGNLVENGGYNNLFADFDLILPQAPGFITSNEGYGYYALSGNDYTCVGGGAHSSGVNIRIGEYVGNPSLTPGPFFDYLFDYLDNQIDNNDGEHCGRIRRGGSSDSIYYLISPTPNDLTF